MALATATYADETNFRRNESLPTDALIYELDSRELPGISIAAFRELVQRGKNDPEKVVPLLIKKLKNKETRITIRRAVAGILGHIGRPESLTELSEVLKNEKEDTRLRAYSAEALGKIENVANDESRKNVVQTLIQAIPSVHKEIRIHAVEALGRLKAQEAADPLVVYFESSDEKYRAFTFEALGRIGDRKALGQAHLKVLKGREPEGMDGGSHDLDDNDGFDGYTNSGSGISYTLDERLNSARALPYFFKPAEIVDIVKDLGNRFTLSDSDSVKRAAAQKTFILPAIYMLGDPNIDAEVRRNIVFELANIEHLQEFSPVIIEPLGRILTKDSDSSVRAYAAGALGQTKDGRAVDFLLTALSDDDDVVQNYAIKSLGRIGDKRAIPPLLEKLKILETKNRNCATAEQDRIKLADSLLTLCQQTDEIFRSLIKLGMTKEEIQKHLGQKVKEATDIVNCESQSPITSDSKKIDDLDRGAQRALEKLQEKDKANPAPDHP